MALIKKIIFTAVLNAALIFSLSGVIEAQQPLKIPSGVKITATEVKVPPVWAVMERNLIKTIEQAAPLYVEKYTNRGGRLKANGKVDDDFECFTEWPLFYAIGGDEKVLDLSVREFNAIIRQWTYEKDSLENDFVKEYDPLHLTEGYVWLQNLGLADPKDKETIERSRRIAGLYLNETPGVKIYDPVNKIIPSIATGIRGLAETADCIYTLNYGHASLYPLVKELESGWEKDPTRLAEIQKFYDKTVTRCDIPMNLTLTGLVTSAYLYTGEEKYKNWVLEYVDAWMERIKQNNGIIPDNIGQTGKTGEYRDGQWWGGFFGWNGRYSIIQIFRSLATASECAVLVSGDNKYSDLLRSQINVLFKNSKERDGNLVVPYRYGPDGWFDYRPLDAEIPSHLWHETMSSGDWEYIDGIRKGTKNGPLAISVDDGAAGAKKGKELWQSDGTPFNWNETYVDLRRWQNIYNEPAYLSWLAGTNPGWPEEILGSEYKHVRLNLDRLVNGNYKHEWGSQTWLEMNPVLVNGLRQLTMGGPHIGFNGGLVCTAVRYFDTDRMRPGLPQDTSALVKKNRSRVNCC